MSYRHSMTEVSVFLDVDGVFNAVNYRRPQWGWADEGVTKKVAGFPIRWSTELVERVNALAQRGHVKMHWLTTWCYEAPQRLAPALGIEGAHWPVVGADHHQRGDFGSHWWKLAAIQDHLTANPGKAVWVDDDFAFDEPAQLWAQDQAELLCVAPRTELGLTREQMEQIEEFVG